MKILIENSGDVGGDADHDDGGRGRLSDRASQAQTGQGGTLLRRGRGRGRGDVGDQGEAGEVKEEGQGKAGSGHTIVRFPASLAFGTTSKSYIDIPSQIYVCILCKVCQQIS